MQGVDALQNTHFFFKIWLCYCLPQKCFRSSSCDRLKGFIYESMFVCVCVCACMCCSVCVCVCVCCSVCATSLKKVDIFKCKSLYRIKLNTTIYVLTETGWQKLKTTDCAVEFWKFLAKGNSSNAQLCYRFSSFSWSQDEIMHHTFNFIPDRISPCYNFWRRN